MFKLLWYLKCLLFTYLMYIFPILVKSLLTYKFFKDKCISLIAELAPPSQS